MKQFRHVLFVVILIGCSKSPITPPTPAPTPTSTVLSFTSFSPASGKTGDTITIEGTGFGTDASLIGVSFTGASVKVKPASITAVKLTVIVPTDGKTGKLGVFRNKTDSVFSSSSFTKIEPEKITITSFTPQTGRVGDTVKIIGTAFGTDTNAVLIKFGGSVGVKPNVISATSISVIVPADAKTGKIDLAFGSTVISTTTNFTVKAPLPTITSFSPKTVTYLDTLKITGTGFGTSLTSTYVVFGDVIKPIQISPTEIVLIVPMANPARVEPITVSITGVGDVKSTENLTNLPPLSVSQVNFNGVASARTGELVEINGGFFKADYASMTVRFTGSTVDVKPILLGPQRDNYFLVRVPADAQSGKIKVTKPGYGPGKTQNDLTILAPMPAVQSGTWTQRPDFPENKLSGRDGSVSFVINDKAYVGMGTTRAPFDGYASSDIWQYDPQYNSWMQVASMGGGGRVYATAFVVGNKAYVGTGQNNDADKTADFWEYNPDNNVWTKKADFIGNPRFGTVSFAIGNNAYVGCGVSDNGSANGAVNNDFYQYSTTTNTWSSIAAIPGDRSNAFSFVLGGKGFVGGGLNNNPNGASAFYMFDPSSNSWTAKATIPNYLYMGGNATFVLNGKAYVGLGYKIENGIRVGTKQVFEYSSTADTWTAMPNFSGSARHCAVGFAIGNVGYFGLGAQDGGVGVYKDFWAYTP